MEHTERTTGRCIKTIPQEKFRLALNTAEVYFSCFDGNAFMTFEKLKILLTHIKAIINSCSLPVASISSD